MLRSVRSLALAALVPTLSVIVLSGCTAARSAEQPMAEAKPAPAAAPAMAPIVYSQAVVKGRLLVAGSPEGGATIQAGGHLPIARTYIGQGPDGMTVVIEAHKHDDAWTDALYQEYQKRNPYYRELEAHERLYVVGSLDSSKSFKGHLPLAKTFIGKGPQGQTVVFEIDKNDETLLPRLVQTFNNKYGTKLAL